eukprot:ANDGO_03647.mRNA.1 hypothetical protein DQ04_09211020
MSRRVIGKTELLSWASRFSSRECSRLEDLKDGVVILKIISRIWPFALDFPRDSTIRRSAKEAWECNHNHKRILELLDSVGVPRQFVDSKGILSASFKPCFNALVLFFFLSSLQSQHDITVDFSHPIDDRIAAFLQSEDCLRCLGIADQVLEAVDANGTHISSGTDNGNGGGGFDRGADHKGNGNYAERDRMEDGEHGGSDIADERPEQAIEDLSSVHGGDADTSRSEAMDDETVSAMRASRDSQQPGSAQQRKRQGSQSSSSSSRPPDTVDSPQGFLSPANAQRPESFEKIIRELKRQHESELLFQREDAQRDLIQHFNAERQRLGISADKEIRKFLLQLQFERQRLDETYAATFENSEDTLAAMRRELEYTRHSLMIREREMSTLQSENETLKIDVEKWRLKALEEKTVTVKLLEGFSDRSGKVVRLALDRFAGSPPAAQSVGSGKRSDGLDLRSQHVDCLHRESVLVAEVERLRLQVDMAKLQLNPTLIATYPGASSDRAEKTTSTSPINTPRRSSKNTDDHPDMSVVEKGSDFHRIWLDLLEQNARLEVQLEFAERMRASADERIRSLEQSRKLDLSTAFESDQVRFQQVFLLLKNSFEDNARLQMRDAVWRNQMRAYKELCEVMQELQQLASEEEQRKLERLQNASTNGCSEDPVASAALEREALLYQQQMQLEILISSSLLPKADLLDTEHQAFLEHVGDFSMQVERVAEERLALLRREIDRLEQDIAKTKQAGLENQQSVHSCAVDREAWMREKEKLSAVIEGQTADIKLLKQDLARVGELAQIYEGRLAVISAPNSDSSV